MRRVWCAAALVAWITFGVLPLAGDEARVQKKKTAVDQLAWMSGRWSGEIRGVAMEELWTAPSGGIILGLHRDVGGPKTSFEFLRIAEVDGRLAYLASPGCQPAVKFPVAEIGKNRVVFENRQHDFPQRIIYWMSGPKLCARVEGPAGGEMNEEWCWSRDRSALGAR